MKSSKRSLSRRLEVPQTTRSIGMSFSMIAKPVSVDRKPIAKLETFTSDILHKLILPRKSKLTKKSAKIKQISQTLLPPATEDLNRISKDKKEILKSASKIKKTCFQSMELRHSAGTENSLLFLSPSGPLKSRASPPIEGENRKSVRGRPENIENILPTAGEPKPEPTDPTGTFSAKKVKNFLPFSFSEEIAKTKNAKSSSSKNQSLFPKESEENLKDFARKLFTSALKDIDSANLLESKADFVCDRLVSKMLELTNTQQKASSIPLETPQDTFLKRWTRTRKPSFEAGHFLSPQNNLMMMSATRNTETLFLSSINSRSGILKNLNYKSPREKAKFREGVFENFKRKKETKKTERKVIQL